MKEKILEILKEVNEDIVTYDGDAMMEEGVIDSFEVIEIVGELEDAFEIEIDAKYVVADNFKNTESIIMLVERLLNK